MKRNNSKEKLKENVVEGEKDAGLMKERRKEEREKEREKRTLQSEH